MAGIVSGWLFEITCCNMSLVVKKPVSGFLTRSDSNWAVQLQKMARALKFRKLRRGIVISVLRKQRC